MYICLTRTLDFVLPLVNDKERLANRYIFLYGNRCARCYHCGNNLLLISSSGMNYELAQKLKDAGFPLKCTTYTTNDFVFGVAVKDGENVLYPLLSELIEACGENFLDLIRTVSWGEVKWVASGRKEDGRRFPTFQVKDFSTPEEAVAELWLAINKK